MFSNDVHRTESGHGVGTTHASPRTLSLALRLTLWYTLAAFLLVLATSGFLYFGLVRILDEEDDQFLIEKLRAVQRVLQNDPVTDAAVRQEVTAGGADRHAGRLYARVVLAFADSAIIETPGMSDFLPVQLFDRDDSETAWNELGTDGRPVRLHSVQTSRGDHIHIGMDRSGDDEVLEHFRKRLSYALGLSLFFAAGGGLWIARRGLRPLADMSAVARKIGPSHLGERIDLSRRPAEVTSLAETFNLMLDRLEDAFSRLGRFTADIAHELRTPVNALRSEVEITLGRPRSEDEYRIVLASCLDECDRLTRLINSLLLLARAEDPRRELVTDTVDVDDELRIALEFYEPSASEQGIHLRLQSEGDLRIQADRTLVQQAIGNLVSNALAHTPSGGIVTLFGSRAGSQIRFGVRDTGGGIAPEHLTHIFERFYRTPNGKVGGMGLGLAIVHAVARLHGGSVEASSDPDRETTVTLTLPAHLE